LRLELEAHLSVLVRQEVIAPWSFRMIQPGEEWGKRIDEHLNSAAIILLLVSADFLNSDYCWSVEMKRALERHDRGEAVVVPVVLRECEWKTQELAKLQALPRNARPVTQFRRRDTAWTDVVRGVRGVAESIADNPRLDRQGGTDVAAILTGPPQASANPSKNGLGSSGRAKESFKLLAIEDDPEVLALYKTFLTKRGHEVIGVSTAMDGIYALGQHPDIDFIILDLNLPVMSGQAWLTWYRQQGFQQPVVIATGRADALAIAGGNRNTAVLTKPFHMDELHELLAVVLDHGFEDGFPVEGAVPNAG